MYRYYKTILCTFVCVFMIKPTYFRLKAAKYDTCVHTCKKRVRKRNMLLIIFIVIIKIHFCCKSIQKRNSLGLRLSFFWKMTFKLYVSIVSRLKLKTANILFYLIVLNTNDCENVSNNTSKKEIAKLNQIFSWNQVILLWEIY